VGESDTRRESPPASCAGTRAGRAIGTIPRRGGGAKHRRRTDRGPGGSFQMEHRWGACRRGFGNVDAHRPKPPRPCTADHSARRACTVASQLLSSCTPCRLSGNGFSLAGTLCGKLSDSHTVPQCRRHFWTVDSTAAGHRSEGGSARAPSGVRERELQIAGYPLRRC
jgi:hypothetical protein